MWDEIFTLPVGFIANFAAEECRDFGRQCLGAIWTLSLSPIFSGPFSSFITTHTMLSTLHPISFQPSFPSFSSYSHLLFNHINSISGFIFPFGFPPLTSFHHIKLLSPFTLFCTSISRGISAELKTMTREFSGGSLEDLIFVLRGSRPLKEQHRNYGGCTGSNLV